MRRLRPRAGKQLSIIWLVSARQYLNPCSLILWSVFFKSLSHTALKGMDLST